MSEEESNEVPVEVNSEEESEDKPDSLALQIESRPSTLTLFFEKASLARTKSS